MCALFKNTHTIRRTMLLFYGNYNKLIEQKFASSSTPFAFV